MKKDPRARIPSEDLTAYERWELPLLDERGNEVWSRDEELDLKPLTAEDLENIRQAALEDGAREGRAKGHKDGFEQGRKEGHKAAREEGFKEGEKAGLEAGRASSKTELEAGLGRLQTLMAELLDPLDRQTENLETALLNLTLSVTRAVIQRELQLDSGQIREVLKQAVAALPNQEETIRIYVNPLDLAAVQEVAGRFEAAARIVEDETLLPGGCRVENRNSLVDFTIEKRFQKAVQTMLDRQLQGSGSLEQGEIGALMGEMTDFHRDVLESEPEKLDDTTDQTIANKAAAGANAAATHEAQSTSQAQSAHEAQSTSSASAGSEKVPVEEISLVTDPDDGGADPEPSH